MSQQKFLRGRHLLQGDLFQDKCVGVTEGQTLLCVLLSVLRVCLSLALISGSGIFTS